MHCIFQRYLADWVPSEALKIYQKINRCSLEISFFKPSGAVVWSSVLADESRTRITPRERSRYKILNRRLGSENRARTLGWYVYFFLVPTLIFVLTNDCIQVSEHIQVQSHLC